jgi:hypothetical protein
MNPAVTDSKSSGLSGMFLGAGGEKMFSKLP